VSDKEEFPPLLEPGFHAMTLAEVHARCVTAFPLSTTRLAVMAGLEKFVGMLRAQGVRGELWIDGSFMTSKIDPEDADVVLVVQSSFYEHGTEAQQALVDLIAVADFKPDYFCDAYVLWQYDQGDELHAHGEWERAYWLRQFGFSRGVEKKGLGLIELR
jgi:hypothetical protein